MGYYLDPLVHEAAERAAAGARLLLEELDGNEHVRSSTKSVASALLVDTAELAQMLLLTEQMQQGA